jgi:hypothetical protein
LISTIRQGYQRPQGFDSAADMAQRQALKDAEARQSDEARRRTLNEAAGEREDRRRALDYWNAMTPEAQAAFDLAAQAEADPESRALLAGSMRRLAVKTIRHQALLRRMRDDGQ